MSVLVLAPPRGPCQDGRLAVTDRPIALQAVTDERLAAAVGGITPAYARKILADVHREQPIRSRTGLPQRAIAALEGRASVPRLEVTAEQHAADGFHKLRFASAGNASFEAVRIPLDKPGRFSVCVSSQAGCALACAFCATGRLGLLRNLETWEIVEQVRTVARGLAPGSRVRGVVFQGMGEPMANLDRVLAAIAVLTAPYAMQIDTRAVTVSTAGLPDGIRRLAREAPRVRLALSIGSARPELRARLMPITAAHSLTDVIDAGVEHARATGLSPMWAVTLLDGVNDSDDDAHALAALARSFLDRAGHEPRVSVIPYNRIDGDERDPFRRSSDARTAAFRDILSAAGFRSQRRYSGGGEVAAACGQLVAGASASTAPRRRARVTTDETRP